MPYLLSAIERPTKPPRTTKPASDLPPLVLIVEDHEDTRELYRYLLEGSGFRVIEAGDGEQGVAIAQSSQPDLILMDTNLPHLDGIMAMHLIRELQPISTIPIIFLSGHAQPEARAKALENGGNDYLVKPVDPIDLEVAVHRQLGLRARGV